MKPRKFVIKKNPKPGMLSNHKTGSSAVEEFLGFETGTFDRIPHHAREQTLATLLHIREMERMHVFQSGLYYTVLSVLCRTAQASRVLGREIGKKRIETFILTCVEALDDVDTTDYHIFLREIGDAVLMLFSSFNDAYAWWQTMHSWLESRNRMWASQLGLSNSELKQFRLESKTIIHAGEVSYSGTKDPLSAVVKQVFKVEKKFKAYELGLTHQTLLCVHPLLRSLGLQPIERGKIQLPGNKQPMRLYLIDRYKKDGFGAFV